MEIGVLGPAEACRGSAPVDLGPRKQRALLGALALHRGRTVPVDTLVDLLWADAPPPGAVGTLQGYVAGLRRVLEPERQRRTAATVLVTRDDGYALALPDGALDVDRLETRIGAAHRRLGPTRLPSSTHLSPDELAATVTDLDDGLRLWRGTPFAELEDAPAVVAERARLQELRLLALEDRAIVRLGLGQHGQVAAELESLTAEHPVRERLWALRAAALAGSGRQADALEVLRTVREVLVEELGIEPGVELRDLQAAVLRQDPALGPVSVRRSAPPATPTAATAQAGAAEPSAPAPWPMVGRDRQLADLVTVLDRAGAGVPAFAAVVGEPGIGKSRLCAELAAVAHDRGAVVAVGRCSQDEGAPPLWPWRSVLAAVGAELPTDVGAEDEGTRFRSWDRVVEVVRQAAEEQPLLVVLDDLHWSDVTSLRVLALLLENLRHGRVAVVCTWRDDPPPGPALAAVAEGLARRHAVRLGLAGLPEEDVATVVEAVAEQHPSAEEAAALRRRTDGNPFFLVEFARLAQGEGALGDLLAEPDPPAAVNDVLVRRLDRLPTDTARLLQTAAVLGRDFDLTTLAAATTRGDDEDAVLDLLDPALAAGLLREDGPEQFRFAHALTRDAAYASLSATRRARSHAHVARVLEEAGGRETEVARHWLAAGPAHAGRAWRAAVTAAHVARALHGHDESVDLLESAREAMPADPAVTARDRYEVLMDLAEAYRWTGRWRELVATAEAAVSVAEAELHDVALAATAAVSTTVGAIWQSAQYGEVHGPLVAALRRSLDRLPVADHPLRCRVMLALANELFYGAGLEEREALADEALAMARRIGDDALLLDAYQLCCTSLWARRTAPRRLEHAEAAMELADRMGDERSLTIAQVLRTVILGELGRVAEMWAAMAEARERGLRLRLPYAQLVLDSQAVPWLAMAGRFEEGDELLADLRRLAAQVSLPQTEDGIAGAVLVLQLWRGELEPVLPVLREMALHGPLPSSVNYVQFLLRAGRPDEARAWAAEHPPVHDRDDWYSLFFWGSAAEVALGIGDATLGARAYAELAPYAGRTCSAGSGAAIGPVDAFLALAAAATGETDLAARHADQAGQLCETWGVPLVAQWLRDQRDRYGF